jgi:sigma-B regulation protein RsbU (phosphoserine phosphatase)
VKILIAEDDATSRKLLELSLKSWGHDCITAVDGTAALEAWRLHRFDVLITDWMMPEMDGIALIRRVCEIEAQKGRYAWKMLLTTKAFRDNFEVAMQAGVDDFLVKPLDRVLLRVRLTVAARILGMQKQVRDAEALIPICMRCKAVRNSATQWQRIEEYLALHVSESVTHGYCPDCFLAESILPEVKRLEERYGRPVLKGVTPIDPAALDFLRAHEAESPGLADDLVHSFAETAANVDRGLSSPDSPILLGAAPLARFEAAARAVGANALADTLQGTPGMRALNAEVRPALRSALIALRPLHS